MKNIKNFLAAFVSLFVFIAICQNSILSYAADSDISDAEYLLFADLIYLELEDCENKKISDFINSDEFKVKKSKSSYGNSTGSISSRKTINKYIGSWSVDKYFSNDESGFYAAAFKSADGSKIVVSFRGTTDAVGKDGANDIEFGLMSVNAPQITDALSLTADYISTNSDCEISFTGHSLGGALAIETANYYHLKSVTFNSAQAIKTVYTDNTDIFGKVYEGFDTWQNTDHINEQDFIVGTYEYGTIKKGVKHKNNSSSNTFFAHAVKHMLDIDEESGTISLSETIDENLLSDKNAIYSDIDSSRVLVLGSSDDNLLITPKVNSGFDTVYAGNGNDTVITSLSNDSLIGGRGNDFLDGGSSNDTYYYFEGDGTDTIADIEGADVLEVYSDKKISFEEDENYITVMLDKTAIARLDKNARTDGYKGKPSDAKITDYYSSFTVRLINTGGKETDYPVTSTSQNESDVAAIYISGCSSAEIKKDGKTLASLSDGDFKAIDSSISAYFSGGELCAYIKDSSYTINISPYDGETPALTGDSVNASSGESVHFKRLTLDKISSDGALISVSNGAITASSGDVDYQAEQSEYTTDNRFSLSKKIIIMRNGSSVTAPQIEFSQGASSKAEVKSLIADESVAKSDGNKITALKCGCTTFEVTDGDLSAYTKIYILPTGYYIAAIIIFIILIALAAFIVYNIVKKTIKRIIRRRRRRKEKKLLKAAQNSTNK